MKPIRSLALVFVVVCGATFSPIASADQPNMHEALDHLRAARESLQHADAGKGGHRAKAIEYIDKAIDECHQGVDDSRQIKR